MEQVGEVGAGQVATSSSWCLMQRKRRIWDVKTKKRESKQNRLELGSFLSCSREKVAQWVPRVLLAPW